MAFDVRLKGKRALVTGGAGLIGSHISDLLLSEGWTVRAFDLLEPLTHRHGRPSWVREDTAKRAQFIQGDIRNREQVAAALADVDVVFHQAAYGGFMPEIAKFVHVNSFGTAQMLEIIREGNLPVRKIVLASSQVVYQEGAGRCATHGLVFPRVRPTEQLMRGDFSVHCPLCDAAVESVPTPETAPADAGHTVYSITKVDQERLVLTWGAQVGIPTVALRYSCTFGPRQSIFNPYTGVIAIFCTRLLNGLPPILYEDGDQTRDFSYVEDIARANLLAASNDELDGLAANVGSSRATSIRQVAEILSDALGVHLAPQISGEFRPGEMRHLVSDTKRIQQIGYRPAVSLEEGILRYLDWIRSLGDIREYFGEAEQLLRPRGILRRVEAQI
jgi:dTDP-L-rhamnose 4-epimerase